MRPNITTVKDADALARQAASFLIEVLAPGSGKRSVCLSGGSTPKRLYELLATPPFRDKLPWDRIHWFWGDERFVPPDDPESNYGMTRRAMLAAVPAPPNHVHPIPTTGMDPGAAAAAYERTLQAYYGSATLDPATPLFDVTLLGLGEDGEPAVPLVFIDLGAPASQAALDRLPTVQGAGGDVLINSDLNKLLNVTDKLAQKRGCTP